MHTSLDLNHFRKKKKKKKAQKLPKESRPERIPLSGTESKPAGQLAPCVMHVLELKLLSHSLTLQPPLKMHLMWWRPSPSEKVTVCLGNSAKTTAGAERSSTPRVRTEGSTQRCFFFLPEKQNHKQRTLAVLKWQKKELRRGPELGEMARGRYSKFGTVSSERLSISASGRDPSPESNMLSA